MPFAEVMRARNEGIDECLGVQARALLEAQEIGDRRGDGRRIAGRTDCERS
jgi:hypothetical protein